MCWFLFLVCDRCRWPDIGRGLHMVGECDEFRSKFRANPNGPHDFSSIDPAMITPANNWSALGDFTFTQWAGTRWNIIPRRDCIKWGPVAQYHTCDVCQEILGRQMKDWQASFEAIDLSLPALAGSTKPDQIQDPVIRAELEGDPIATDPTDVAK
ncbi:hypothetical protein DOTSEDRAFT_69708 [Dothistroma septosporum NZE10]|uniref:Uncharacterized protein n=1 Tax=Dothistroma septosporum (strain NZE10 / CBS 128990) TaxID=675120 RepID=N1Q057_DOTSN|nr:hypothetical protein DOTSEDRAFT_69708 [Dothistroma septosporum NZE10]